jgi:Uma2 family endonuclease
MVAAAVSRSPSSSADPAERRFVLHDVPWWTYVALRDALDHPGVRMTYLKGTLELMSPWALHEESKKIIARLIDAWAEEKNVDLRGFGRTRATQRLRRRIARPWRLRDRGTSLRTQPVPHGVPRLRGAMIAG